MSSAELAIERSLYVGNALGAILYGVQLTLCCQSVYFLCKGAPASRKRNISLIVYSLILALFVAIGLAANFVFGQLTWIDRRNVPGGPAEFFGENVNSWYNTFGTSGGYAGIFLGDALMLYRCYTITGCNLWLTIPPAILFLGSTALGIVSIIASAAPNAFLLEGRPAQFGTAWTSLSVGFNIIVTIIICVKLYLAYRRLRAIASPEYADIYTGAAAILIESAFPYAFFGIIFSILYGLNNVSSLAFAIVWIAFTGISPQLIILRVARGTAWSKNTISNAPESSMKFREHSNMLEHGSDSTVNNTNLNRVMSK
ncbi:hypothetical protein HYPSUDRAFT_38125 [Hypholoma sublateritium FD-334 SS-4]|uniref:Uncharacterized protein n=1 Tax=Hypholoma sublateritium (strain FD-334 SS-4) TaxID=945553 RepID=A0A0D2P2M5_HYPSF|nr:hypothetical protein HYPSUDRAFT_38125 [Hypholoma sublateritium FD-334 SS-4]